MTKSGLNLTLQNGRGPAAVGTLCVLPFRHRGRTYNGCTKRNVDIEDSDAWCSTGVDEFGVHVTGKWGECGKGCPLEEEEDESDVG